MDDNTLEEAAKVFTEVATTATVYQDALQPVTKQIGRSLETLGGVINVALAPLALMVHGYELVHEKLKQRLEEKLGTVPKEQIVSPPLLIVGPLLEKYRFAHDQPDLAELYENLLAGAMDEQTVRNAHPAFVQIIAQLCPDEAKLLKVISDTTPKIDVQLGFTQDSPGAPWPDGTLDILNNLTNLDRQANLDPVLTRAFIVNLERLGILKIRSGAPLIKNDLYDDLLNHPEFKKMQKKYEAKFKLTIIKGHIDTTDFGYMFMKAAVWREDRTKPAEEV
jgi:hypothetical protein